MHWYFNCKSFPSSFRTVNLQQFGSQLGTHQQGMGAAAASHPCSQQLVYCTMEALYGHAETELSQRIGRPGSQLEKPGERSMCPRVPQVPCLPEQRQIRIYEEPCSVGMKVGPLQPSPSRAAAWGRAGPLPAGEPRFSPQQLQPRAGKEPGLKPGRGPARQ